MKQRDFRTVKTLCDTLMVAVCHHTFVQSHLLHNTKSDPNVNWDCELTMTCHCRFLGRNRCVPLAGMLIMGKAVSRAGIWESSFLLIL